MLEDNTSKFGTLVLVKQRTPLLPLYNKAVQVGRTVINFSVKAQHAGSGGMVSEGTANKFGMKDKKRTDKPDTGALDILSGNLPMTSPENLPADPDNQAMISNPNTNAFATNVDGNGNQNDQMQMNEESDPQQAALPNFQPGLLPQNTMPPDDYYAPGAINTQPI